MSFRIPNKLVVLCHPRTGSTCIRNFFGIPDGPRHRTLDELDYENEKIYVTVRNPFDLIATWYQMHSSIGSMDFFIRQFEHSHFVRNGKLFWLIPDMDYELLRYEFLEERLKEIANEHNLPIGPFEILNSTSGKKANYRDYYDEKTVQMVYDIFGEELEEFGYAFE